jgi:SPP1 gp7 family putative phage head morphogenesis protein
LGVRHSTDEISKAQKEQFRANMGRIDEDAAAFLETNGFRMLGNMTADMKKIIQGILVNGVKFSWTTKDIVEKIYDSLTSAGFIVAETNSVATGRPLVEIAERLQKTVTTPARIQTAIRTNAFEAINEARYSTFTDPALDGFVEALEYSAILDDRTTEICRHLDGRVYPADSPAWDGYKPPNHFNCRSLLVPVTIIDTEVEGKDKLKGERWSKPPRIEPQQGFGGTTG